MKKISNCLGNVQMMAQSYCYTLSCIRDILQAKAMGFFNYRFDVLRQSLKKAEHHINGTQPFSDF